MSTDPAFSPDSNHPEQIPSDKPSQPSHQRRHWAVWGAILCILFGAGYLLSQRSTQPSGQGKKGKQGAGAIPVAVAQVTQGNIGVYINALGTVTPVYTVSVTSRVVGQLLQVNYKEGQIVHKGDLLAVVDPRPYAAVLTQAQGQLARDQALLKNAYIDLDRYKMIYQQHAIPEQQLATQQATVDQDQGTVKLDQGNLDAAQVNVEYTRITAPIDGRVGLRQVDPGNIVQANGTAPLLTITQIQPITVIFTMAEDYLSEVITQMRAGHRLRVDALDRDSQTDLAQGTVLTIDNQIDPTTGTVKVRATFSNRDFKLFPNEFVNAKLLVRTLNSVNLIPTAAIQRNSDVAFVYVVNPTSKTVQSRNINVATTDGDTAAVTGVKPGEALVTDGFDRLQDGVKIVVRKPTITADETRNPETNQTATEQTKQGNAGTESNTNQQNSQQVHPK
jgi:multidrug efflux system membrane fusion protein